MKILGLIFLCLTSHIPLNAQHLHSFGNEKPQLIQNTKNSPKASNTKGEESTFEDHFDTPESLKNYATLKPADAWSVRDGILIANQTDPSHGCVIRKHINFDDVTMEIKFRFNGGSRFNFVFDDQNEKSVHAAHICRVSLSPKQLRISDDKSGSMNLDIRKRRKQNTLTAEDKETLSAAQTSAPLNLKKGQWYQLQVIIKGDTLEAFIDQKPIVKLKSPGIDHPTFTKLGMTVTGTTIDFDDFKVLTN